MLTFDEARARVLALARPLGGERVPTGSAAGRVLRRDIRAPFDVPARDLSVMDGWAVRAAEHASPGSAAVQGEVRAGGAPPPPLEPGHAMRIFTGAPLPDGADAVILQERASRHGGSVRFDVGTHPGAFVRRRGDDLRAGDVALRAGTRLRPAHCALAASLDVPVLEVARRPQVTVLCTGDELRDAGATGAPGQIADACGVAVAQMAERAGARVVLAPIVRDDLAAIRAAVGAALSCADVLVTVGGVSVGDADLVKAALEAEGVTLAFWRVALKPGKPLCVGTRGERVVLGLPGNPVSAMVTFGLFGVPLLRACEGDAAPLPEPIPVRVAETLAHEPGRLELLRVTLSREGSTTIARPVRHQASAAIVGMACADALLAIPADSAGLVAGDDAVAYLLSALCA
jgi:molybdopterin molybdotransferase